MLRPDKGDLCYQNANLYYDAPWRDITARVLVHTSPTGYLTTTRERGSRGEVSWVHPVAEENLECAYRASHLFIYDHMIKNRTTCLLCKTLIPKVQLNDYYQLEPYRNKLCRQCRKLPPKERPPVPCNHGVSDYKSRACDRCGLPKGAMDILL